MAPIQRDPKRRGFGRRRYFQGHRGPNESPVYKPGEGVMRRLRRLWARVPEMPDTRRRVRVRRRESDYADILEEESGENIGSSNNEGSGEGHDEEETKSV